MRQALVGVEDTLIDHRMPVVDLCVVDTGNTSQESNKDLDANPAFF